MTLTREAWDRFNQYLADMRGSLAGSTASEVAEIEQDIRDHVDAELSGRSVPVSAEDLDDVLRRLGRPGQWASDPVPPIPSRPAAANSFEDWLAYASAASVLALFIFPPLLILSWIMSRWTIARLEERGEPLGTRQWLLYPPIVMVLGPLAILAAVWALAPFAELGGGLFNRPDLRTSPPGDVVGALAVALGGLGAYWVLFGTILAVGERVVRFLLYPFGQGFRRWHGWYIAIAGAALALASAATAFFIWR
jgi:hypothetical protein